MGSGETHEAVKDPRAWAHGTPRETLPGALPQARIDVRLDDEFARELPELSVPWEAARPDRPRLLALNEGLAGELGLDPDALRSEAGVRFLLGNELAPGSRPVAQAYAGHQFGGFSPRLGDGRALLLGEIVDAAGETRDLHLKGSGRTPFARADGFAAAAPMLREYAVGEAMHALGIPTTRALAVVGTGRLVPRDDELLPGAVLVRVAASHLRVGSFQYAAARRDHGLLARVADLAIRRHYPQLIGSDRPYLGLLREVIAAQAELMASWMLVGFVHGVMNTDNTTISGETIDYGPCAFLDAYDPAAVFSSIDHGGRYAYGAQPTVMLWNLTRLAEAMLPLLGDDDAGGDGTDDGVAVAEEALAEFAPAYQRAWAAGMRAKLGLAGRGSGTEVAASDAVVTEISFGLLQDLRDRSADYTLGFRDLAKLARSEPITGGGSGLTDAAELGPWYETWIALRPDADAMDRTNPIHIPRNRTIDAALEAASAGDPALFDSLIEAVTRPFDARPDLAPFAIPATTPRERYRTFCGT